jgi:hypothetical protein
MLLESPEVRLAETPDRIIMVVPGLSGNRARNVAQAAVRECRRKMPKMSGASAARLQPVYGKGYFGIAWMDSYVWFQDHGIQPFTMKSLAGKTIPMWIDDPTGKERSQNPKAKVRTTMSGKVQVLIFRRAANIGQRITKYGKDPRTGQRIIISDRPASYPGAPGRISNRESASPSTRAGKSGGQIAKGNGGVRWRHPGIAPRLFLNNACTLAAQWNGILPVRLYLTDRNWRGSMRGVG